MNLTCKEVQELFEYIPSRGELVWRYNPDRPAWWNGKHAGKPAGHTGSNGYVMVRVNGRSHKAHRLIWLHAKGSWPKGCIDHINGNKSDNRLTNLRDVSLAENQRNQRRRKQGVFGVYWNAGRWQAHISINGESVYLGRFCDWFDAVCARKSAERLHGFHENHGSNA